MKNKILYGLLIITISLILTGCSKLKTANQIKKYLNKNYNINVEIIKVEKGENYKKYTVKETSRELIFTCTSTKVGVGMDASIFWYKESTSDNYYEKLTESISEGITKISSKYNVEFKKDSSGLINKIIIDDNEIDFDNTLNAINELMKIYNLNKIPETKISSIYLYNNNEKTKYYYNYTVNSEKAKLNEEVDNSEQWDIPEQLETDALNYINSLYDGNCYINDSSIIPISHQIYNDTYISYIIVNDVLKFKKEFRFNLDQYRKDLNNRTLKPMESYMDIGTEYVY